MNPTSYSATPSTDPNVDIRSDMWPNMNITQLTRQQEIVIDRINKLTTIMSSGYSQSFSTIYGALQQANKDLASLIDRKTQQEK